MDISHPAGVLVSNPAWERFFSEMHKLYYDQWVAERTVEARERLHLKVEVLDDLKTFVESTATEVFDGRT